MDPQMNRISARHIRVTHVFAPVTALSTPSNQVSWQQSSSLGTTGAGERNALKAGSRQRLDNNG
jgi:hypothetical protein